jgi:hypothetical protein
MVSSRRLELTQLPESLGDADSFAGNKQKQRLENSPKSLSKSPAAHDEFSAYLNPPFPFRTQWSDSMSQSLVIRVAAATKPDGYMICFTGSRWPE